MKKIGDAVVCPHCGYDNSKPNEDYQLPAGTVLKEQYLVGRVLGQGGFGITYMGWDQYLEMPVAIKEYYPTGAVSRNNKNSTDVISGGGEVGSRFRNNKERFMREVKMLAVRDSGDRAGEDLFPREQHGLHRHGVHRGYHAEGVCEEP